MDAPHQISSHTTANTVFGEADFELLYRSHWKGVFRICYHYVQDQELAADLSQNVFEMVWRKRAILQADTAIDRYLYRAAKLEAQSFCRSQALHRQHEAQLQEAQAQGQATTEKTILLRELQHQVNHLLAELPHKSVYIYRLSREQGLDNKSISTQLSLSEKSVEYHLYKVLSFLRKHLFS